MSDMIPAIKKREVVLFIVTGGGSGIGKALAVELAHRGEVVLIVGRRQSILDEVASMSSSISSLQADVSTEEGRALVENQVAKVPRIKALVHNAGTVEPFARLGEIQTKDWLQAFATNVEPALFLTQQLSSKLIGGRVLNISSGAIYYPIPGCATYCATKAALSMLTKCWQLEEQRFLTTSVLPGISDTAMFASIRHSDLLPTTNSDFYKQLYDNQRIIKPEVVALFLSWLLIDCNADDYQSKEWDIYDTTHHNEWLKPPHTVPSLE
jgi:benzil reductase ((S)-benzoin forming)